MAILDNRSKTQNALVNFSFAMPGILRRFSAIFFILLSLQLMYLPRQERIEKTTLEFSGITTEFFSTIFKVGVGSVQGIGESIDYMSDLRAENIALRLENARLRDIEERAVALKSENISLKQSLNFVSEPQYATTPARLVAAASSVYKDSAIIHVGARDGAQKDQIVINANGIIGRIIEASERFSKVMLITDFGSRIPVISSHSRLQAVVAGIGESKARLLYLPDTSLLQVGEILMTSGDGKLYPAGLPVARVSKIIADEVYVTPIVDLSKIEFMGVIMNNNIDKNS